ncbi:DNA polymerase III subunit gamma and tau [Isoptericola sp. b515]|uniref:DNA polymerase III subunit gamma and tau n=1 Tax=Isoptericola sp. b515 TaxID=3064652 RepID=UPI002713391E|nr:DNA polymerase III subunit gamma and tau [Isoptericola sp. b515]MDO8149202.1 DNA polymerase III subunit gamma and tau [Isoptericola sp. b515]
MTTALYRRYRPETFAEVIGQDHVTAPLRQALRTGRANHAYLFSGPRGCGKTTSARILARTLNCHRNTPEKPLDTPCGECPSCVELARGGPGSLDVVEIDAASHNGVDDARDLRERATFAPARDRYKIFVLDEAHMVTSHGFNALLKIVEEPPEHIKFVFATTEPDKVIGTIRSRTHHYPFRLVPPDVLGPYLEQLCAAEGIELGAGVVPLVTRAGGGSVRDTLSVLDQLIAGSSGTVEYDLAVSLLGFTHGTLLDDVVDAIAARDGASIFRVIDHVIATGHEPRRFVEDVLERLRDLIVIAVSGEAADAVLRDLPADQLERMRHQAANLGFSELSRAADLVNTALTEMTGATSPRLHLELLCARLLRPGADDGTEGLAARLDRLERGAVAAGPVGAVPGTTTPPAVAAEPAEEPTAPAGLSGAAAARAALARSRRTVAEVSAPEPVPEPTEPSPREAAPAQVPAPAPVEATPGADDAPTEARETTEPVATEPPAPAEPVGTEPSEPGSTTEPEAPVTDRVDAAEPPVGVSATEERATTAPPAARPQEQPAAPAPSAEPTGTTAEDLRRRWEEIVANLASPVTRALVEQNAQIGSLAGDRLRLSFQTEGLARNFSQPRHLEAFAEAVYQTLGLRAQIDVTVGAPGPASAPGEQPAVESGPSRSQEAPESDGPAPQGADGGAPSAPSQVSAATTGRTGVAVAERVADPVDSAPHPDGPAHDRADDAAADAARAADDAWLAGASAATSQSAASAASAAPSGGAPARPDPDEAVAAAPTVSWSHDTSASTGTPAPVGPSADPWPHRMRSAAATAAPAPERSPATPATAPDEDDTSDTDAELVSSGLVGVPLVVKMLDGKIIDETADEA